MTRAEDKLFFTAANYYGEAKREKKLSPFIFEALGDQSTSAEKSDKAKQLPLTDYKDNISTKTKKKFRLQLADNKAKFIRVFFLVKTTALRLYCSAQNMNTYLFAAAPLPAFQ